MSCLDLSARDKLRELRRAIWIEKDVQNRTIVERPESFATIKWKKKSQVRMKWMYASASPHHTSVLYVWTKVSHRTLTLGVIKEI